MATEMVIKRGDRRPSIVIQCLDGATPVNLTGATSAKFIMGTVDAGGVGTPKVNAAATITNAVLGEVTYHWILADVDTIGEYKAEVEVTWSDGKLQTFPAAGYLTVKVVADIA